MGAGLSSTGTDGPGWIWRMWGVFWGGENGGDQSCSWGRRPSSSFPGLSVRLGLAWGQSQGGWAPGRADLRHLLASLTCAPAGPLLLLPVSPCDMQVFIFFCKSELFYQ